jgi:hypothetical protein
MQLKFNSYVIPVMCHRDSSGQKFKRTRGKGPAVVLIILLGGWLLREINGQFKVVSDSGFGIYVPHNRHNHS